MSASPESAAKKRRRIPRAESIRLVAGFDLLESLRSRKAIMLLALYLLGSLGASGIFIRVVGAVRARLEADVGQKVDIKQIMSSPGMTHVVQSLSGSKEVAKAIVAIPPMAIFYGWLAIHFVPLLVLFTSADAISGDVSSGAVRFSLFRTDRISWAVGKLIGQTCLMAVGVLIGALGCWVMGLIWFDQMAVADTFYWLLRISGRAIVYSFAYLGMVMCASQMARTNARAGGLALLIMFFCWLSGTILLAEPIQKRAPTLTAVLSRLFPAGHHLALWHPSLVHSGGAMLALVAIGLAFFALGFWRFNTRDA